MVTTMEQDPTVWKTFDAKVTDAQHAKSLAAFTNMMQNTGKMAIKRFVYTPVREFS